MKLSVITDEFTQDLSAAIAFAKRNGLQGVELRTIDDLPLEALSDGRLREIQNALRGEGLAVCDLAGSFYKCRYEDRAAEMKKLERLLYAAEIFDSPFIRCFGFLHTRPDTPSLPEIAAAFDGPLALAAEAGKTLLLEADPTVTTTNHALLARLIEAVRERWADQRDALPPIGAIFDPGNDIYDPLGERPFPDGWQAVAPYVGHVHIKDAVLEADGPRCVKVGTGQAQLPAVIDVLRKTGYAGFLSLETHYRAGSELSELQMARPGGAAFSDGGLEACQESIEALKAMLKD